MNWSENLVSCVSTYDHNVWLCNEKMYVLTLLAIVGTVMLIAIIYSVWKDKKHKVKSDCIKWKEARYIMGKGDIAYMFDTIEGNLIQSRLRKVCNGHILQQKQGEDSEWLDVVFDTYILDIGWAKTDYDQKQVRR